MKEPVSLRTLAQPGGLLRKAPLGVSQIYGEAGIDRSPGFVGRVSALKVAPKGFGSQTWCDISICWCDRLPQHTISVRATNSAATFGALSLHDQPRAKAMGYSLEPLRG